MISSLALAGNKRGSFRCASKSSAMQRHVFLMRNAVSRSPFVMPAGSEKHKSLIIGTEGMASFTKSVSLCCAIITMVAKQMYPPPLSPLIANLEGSPELLCMFLDVLHSTVEIQRVLRAFCLRCKTIIDIKDDDSCFNSNMRKGATHLFSSSSDHAPTMGVYDCSSSGFVSNALGGVNQNRHLKIITIPLRYFEISVIAFALDIFKCIAKHLH